MSAHKVLHNKADFDQAIATPGRYVLVHAHDGNILDKVEEFAGKYTANCDFYSVNTAEEPKTKEYFGITETPAAILYKDGKEVKKTEGKNAPAMQEIVSLISS